jgi:hypothetical protein
VAIVTCNQQPQAVIVRHEECAMEMKTTSHAPDKLTGRAGSGFGILGLLFWSAITLAFDGVWVWMIATQLLTWTYVPAEGTILESRIERGTDSDGDATYDAKIVYEYVAGGRPQRGETVRNFSLRMNGGHQQAQQTVRQYPVRKLVTVYHHAGRPGQSVLERGLRGGDFFLPLFMTPFNIIMLGGWYAMVASWRKGARPAGVRVRDDGLKAVARLHNVTPLTAAVAAVMVSSFVLIFVCGFGMLALPIDWLVTGAWCVVLGSGIAAWSLFRQPATTLEYDHFSGRISIAKSDGQSHAFTTTDVVAVGLDEAPTEPECVDEDDDEDATNGEEPLPVDEEEEALVLHPTITYRDASGKEQAVSLANWSSPDAVTWLVDWLKETLRLKG